MKTRSRPRPHARAWVLVIPGALRGAQPYFNERDPVFHMDGSTLALDQELPE